MGASAKAVDFSGVKDRGNFNPKQIAEGDYAATVTKVEDGESKNGNFQYIFTIKLDKFSQYSYPYYCQLSENTLWKLRNLAVAAGLNVPKKRMKFDPNKIAGKKIGVTIEDGEEYEGKTKSEIGAVFPISELADGALEDDTSDTDEEFEEGGPVAVADDDDFDPEEGADKPKKSKKKDKGEGKKKGKKKDKGDIEEMDISDV
jgi:hypothetical protein